MDPNANMRNDLLIPLYNHDMTLVMRQLSLFETLLGDKESPMKKENAEEIIVAIVSFILFFIFHFYVHLYVHFSLSR